MLLATLVVAALLAASCSDAHTLEEKERAEGATDPRVVTVFQPPAAARTFATPLKFRASAS